MKRRPLNFLTALSLLLSVVAAVLWARSYFVRDAIEKIESNLSGDDAGAVLPVVERIRTVTLARGGVRFDGERLESPAYGYFRTGPPPEPRGVTRRSTPLVGRYPTVRPEWLKTPPALRPAVSWGGFEFAAGRTQPAKDWSYQRWSLTVPVWSIALPTAAWPLWRTVIRRRSRRPGFTVQPVGRPPPDS